MMMSSHPKLTDRGTDTPLCTEFRSSELNWLNSYCRRSSSDHGQIEVRTIRWNVSSRLSPVQEIFTEARNLSVKGLTSQEADSKNSHQRHNIIKKRAKTES